MGVALWGSVTRRIERDMLTLTHTYSSRLGNELNMRSTSNGCGVITEPRQVTMHYIGMTLVYIPYTE